MRVRVNGTDLDFADDVTVRELLDDLGYDRPGVAAAMNGTVVPRTRWASTTVPDGAVLEVLTAVQGG